MSDDKIPTSTSLTVLPADEVRPSTLNWVVREYMGGEVYKAKAGVLEPKSLDDFDMDVPLKNATDLREGDKIAVGGLFGWEMYTVMLNPREEKPKLFGDSKGTIAVLQFAEDDRLCWTCCGQINKRCLDKLQVFSKEV